MAFGWSSPMHCHSLHRLRMVSNLVVLSFVVSSMENRLVRLSTTHCTLALRLLLARCECTMSFDSLTNLFTKKRQRTKARLIWTPSSDNEESDNAWEFNAYSISSTRDIAIFVSLEFSCYHSDQKLRRTACMCRFPFLECTHKE